MPEKNLENGDPTVARASLGVPGKEALRRLGLRKAIVIVSMSCLSCVALAHEGARGVVAERMTAMKNMAQEMKAIGEMLLGKASFDRDVILRRANTLHKNCHGMESMFPPGSMGHHSYAKQTIWEEPEAFQRDMQRLHEASERLLAVAAEGDKQSLMTTVKEVDAACKSCHQTFRRPED